MDIPYGPITLLGSGETSSSGGKVFEIIASQYEAPIRIVILETPAGFEPNSSWVAGRVAEYLGTRLKNYRPTIDVIPARKKGTPFSPDNPKILEPLIWADMIFMGAGSPTYAVRQLAGSLTWDLVRLRNRMGAALVFASAATLAIGSRVIPVYEIYKVGDDVSCPAGLNIFFDIHLELSAVPHWNNIDGGAELDTSRCFIGRERFSEWFSFLPPDHRTLGLDEHTGIILDLQKGLFRVAGNGSVTLLGNNTTEVYQAGNEYGIEPLGRVISPGELGAGISRAALGMLEKDENIKTESIPDEVMALIGEREMARGKKNWKRADDLRRETTELGWEIMDTRNGPVLRRREVRNTR